MSLRIPLAGLVLATTPSVAVRRDTCPSMPEPAERKTEVLINMGNPRKTKPRVWEPRLTAV